MSAHLTAKEARWKSALDNVVAVCHQYSIAHFLDTGTLLGAVRDGKFIPWDNDIDIGLVNKGCEEDAFVQLARACEHLGFIVNMSSTGIGMLSRDGVEINFKYYQENHDLITANYSHFKSNYDILTFIYNVSSGNQFKGYGGGIRQALKNVIIAGIAPFGPVLQYILHRVVQNVELVSNFDRQLILPLTEVGMYGTAYNAPAKIEAYLTARYGPDWRTPKKDYDYQTDDQSFVRGGRQ